MAVVEYARDVLNIKDANSAEFDENTKKSINSYYGRTKKCG